MDFLRHIGDGCAYTIGGVGAIGIVLALLWWFMES